MRPTRSRAAAGERRARPRTEEVATVTIDSIGAGGAGVGRIDGLTCFVPRTAMGDVAQVAYVNHGRYARGRVLQVLESSPDRISPACRHYVQDECGGCQLQHVNSAAQRRTRQHIVKEALARVGQRDVALPDLRVGDVWHYRERLTLTLRQKGSNWIGGLVPWSSGSSVFALEECPIAHPLLIACWSSLRQVLRGLPTPDAGADPLRLSLRMVRAVDGGDDSARVALLVSGARRWPEADAWAAQAMTGVPALCAVWWQAVERAPVSVAGDTNREVLAFAQVNPAMAAQLQAHVLEQVHALAPSSVVDAYSGRGDLAVTLAGEGVRVAAIEADASATEVARVRLMAFPGAQVHTALVEDAIEAVLPADVVVLNPPRRGLDVRVTAALAAAAGRGVRALVYVSCDPATLARDLSRLPQWRITALTCFDMFPQTAHVETVCVLVPENA
ncbi:MAG: class I SAM-dependent RNA methyltransferase [Gemmatimonadaceae bacterium]|nr:class I SAM-dependent RNA methyltransferase [Gemmatimonadaceae bacterium]